MAIALDELRDEAREHGWATARATLIEVRSAAAGLKWVEVPFRSDDDPVTELKSVQQEDARPNSISAVHGLGRQPLHTDGAHLQRPPEVVILMSTAPSSTPTLLWTLAAGRLGSGSHRLPPYDDLRHGVFVVRGGPQTFLATAYSDQGWRFDPNCMSPADDRARRTAAFVSGRTQESHAHQWDEPQRILVIDNSRTLHGRAEVADQDSERLLLRVAYQSTKADV